MAKVAPAEKYTCPGTVQPEVSGQPPDDDPPAQRNSCQECIHHVKQKAFVLCTNKRFDHAVLVLIILNSICLACDDPTGLHRDRQEIVELCELIFQILFTLELVIKVVAYGCSWSNGYLSDPWNRLDCFIVVMGFAEMIVGDAAGSLSAIRCVRALRPLRTINRLPQLKVIITTLLSSLPQLFHVVQLCGFVYSLFALIGLQIWSSGQLHQNCYSDSTGSIQLNDGDLQMCGTSNGALYECDPGSRCIEYWNTPHSGIISFDNFGTALTIAFWVASLESWTNVVVYVEDSTAAAEMWILIFWFVTVVLIGGGLCMNLAPAVLKACFEDVAENNGATPPPTRGFSNVKGDSAADGLLGLQSADDNKATTGGSWTDNNKVTPGDNKVTPGAEDTDTQPLALGGKQDSGLSEEDTLVRMATDLIAQAQDDVKCVDLEYDDELDDADKLTKMAEQLVSSSEELVSVPSSVITGGSDLSLSHLDHSLSHLNCHDPPSPFHDQVVPEPPATPACDDIDVPSPPSSTHGLSESNTTARGAGTGLDPTWDNGVTEAGLRRDSVSQRLELDQMISDFDLDEQQLSDWGSDDKPPPPPPASSMKAPASIKSDEAPPAPVHNLLPSIGVDVNAPKKEDSDKEDYDQEQDLAGNGVAKTAQIIACDCWLSRKCHDLAVTMSFSNFFFVMIALNTVVLIIEGNHLNDTGEQVMIVINYVFTFLFTVELIIKLIAFGINFFTDHLNTFDLAIVFFSLLELAIQAGGSSSTGVLRMLRMLRMARLLKIVRMSRSIGATRVVLSVLFAMLPTLQYIGLLCFLTAFVFAILGMGLFGGKMSFPGTGVPDSNFDHFGWAFLTTFQLITLEDWPVVFESIKNATSWLSIVYVLMVIVIGNFVLLNLMLAIMLAFFEEPEMAAKITRRGVLIEGGGVATNMGAHLMEPEVEAEPPIDKTVQPELELSELDEEVYEIGWCETCKTNGTTQCLQLFCRWLVAQAAWTVTIELMIVINCVFMAIDPNQNIFVLRIIDMVFTVVFVVEVVIKMIAFTPSLYWQDPANKLDFVVVFISVLSLALTPVDLGFLKALRAARVIRPLRLVTRSEGMMLVASSLLQSIPGMLNVGLVCFMGWLTFGILGMEFFQDMDGGYCSDSSFTTEDSCTGMHRNEYGTMMTRIWISTDATFNNTIITYLTLFQVSSLEGWVDIMYYYTKHPDGTYFSSFYFLAWVMLSNWLLVNLWVGVIWINFVTISAERQGWAFLTESQRDWVVSQRRALLLLPAQSIIRPYRVDWFRRWCYDIVTHKVYEGYIAACIMLNMAIIAITHYNQSSTLATMIIGINSFFSVNFFIEALLKIAGFRWSLYWRDGWNRFEFLLAMYVFGDIAVLVVTCLDGVTLPDSGVLSLGLKLVVLTRCLRIVRLMRKLPGVSAMLFTLYRALPAVCNIGLLLMLLLYMYAVAGVILFADVIPRGGITHMHNFKHFGYSCWTLFLICTGDIWPDMMYNCMYDGDECSNEEGNCGFPAAALYYVSLITLVTFLLLNMFVTILVDQFIEARQIFLGKVTVYDLDQFKKMWAFYDREGQGFIAPHHLSALLVELPLPMGLDATKEQREDANWSRGAALRLMSQLELKDYNGTAHFSQVLHALCSRAHEDDIQGADKDRLFAMVKEQRAAAFPDAELEKAPSGDLRGTIDERLAANLILRYIWRKRYVNNLKKGIVPPDISCEFKGSVANRYAMHTTEGQAKAAAILLTVCYSIWGAKPTTKS